MIKGTKLGRKSSSRPLVLGFLEHISSRAFEEFPRQITELVGRQHGVYALYKGNHLYYVGLATNLRGRIKTHLNDRHAGKWDRFSLYLVRKADHIKELESLLLRIADPKGNRTRGRLRQAQDFQKTLRRKIRLEQDHQIRVVMGSKPVAAGAVRAKRVRKAVKGQPSMAAYINGPMAIRSRYKGKIYTAHVRADGSIRFKGQDFNSPSMAGRAIVHRACDGWLFWRFRNTKGEWVRLDEMRK